MIKTWRERVEAQGIGSCEARDDEIDELRAALDALKNQEPVATVRAKSDVYGGTFVHWVTMPEAGMSLYLAPGAQPVKAPLTDRDIYDCFVFALGESGSESYEEMVATTEWPELTTVARAIEAKVLSAVPKEGSCSAQNP